MAALGAEQWLGQRERGVRGRVDHEPGMGSRSQFWQTLVTSTLVFGRSLCAIYVVTKYGVFLSKVSGPSMFPTFSGQGDIVVAEAVSRWFGKYNTGDVVICSRPVDPSENIIKRVVAVEHEQVVVYPDRNHADIRRVQVPTGHVWIQGDNPTTSLDSRQYGPVPIALIKGRVLLQIWPKVKVVQ